MVNPSIEKSADRNTASWAAQLKKALKRAVYRIRTPAKSMWGMSREHDYYTIRLKTEAVSPKTNQIEGIIALARENEKILRNKLKANGFVLGYSKLPLDDPRVLRLEKEEQEMAEKTWTGDVSGPRSGMMIEN